MKILLTICIMLFLFTIITCVYLFQQYKQMKKILPPQPIINNVINFEQDIQFLNYLIAVKIDYAKSFIIAPMKMAISQVITDEITDKIRNDLVTEIYTSLSPSYRKTLSKYFTEEAVIAYITEHIIKELTIAGLESNLNALNSKKVLDNNLNDNKKK